MKYDEFVSCELREKYPVPYCIYYGWHCAGVSDKKANAAGWDDDFVFWTTEGDVIAVIKYMLVYMDGRNPEDVTGEYIKEYFTKFDFAYDDYIRAAFRGDAVARMKKLIYRNRRKVAKHDG